MLKITQNLSDPLPYGGNLPPGATEKSVSPAPSQFENLQETGTAQQALDEYDAEVVLQALSQAIIDNASEGFRDGVDDATARSLAEQDIYQPVGYEQFMDNLKFTFTLEGQAPVEWAPNKVSIYLPEL